jgi:hypothetical protein
MRITIPRGMPIFDPSVQKLRKLHREIAQAGMSFLLRVVFQGQGSRLTAAIGRAMTGLPVVELDLGWNDVTCKAIDALAGLPISSVRHMGHFTPKVGRALVGLPIRKLALSTCSFTGKVATSLIGLPTTDLELRECSDLTTGSFQALPGLPITHLTLHHITSNRGVKLLTVRIFKELRPLQHLTHLDLWGSDPTPEMIEELAGMPITSLGLSYCALTLQLIEALQWLPKLTNLDLSGCRLTLEMLKALARLQSLQTVDFRDCAFTNDMLVVVHDLFPQAELIAA